MLAPANASNKASSLPITKRQIRSLYHYSVLFGKLGVLTGAMCSDVNRSSAYSARQEITHTLKSIPGSGQATQQVQLYLRAIPLRRVKRSRPNLRKKSGSIIRLIIVVCLFIYNSTAAIAFRFGRIERRGTFTPYLVSILDRPLVAEVENSRYTL
jgi:hypothetical protein